MTLSDVSTQRADTTFSSFGRSVIIWWMFSLPGRMGKPAHWEYHGRFILVLQPLGRWEEEGGDKNPMFLKVCGAWFHRTRLRSKREPEGRERHMARGVSKIHGIPYRLCEEHVISLCASEDINKNVNLDKQHPLLASILCHSNTTISLAVLNPALTFHSNTTISLNILAPTLPARLLQYPNVNSLGPSPGRNSFRSRSRRIWCRTQSVPQVSTNGR